MMFYVENLYQKYKRELGLTLLNSEVSLKKRIVSKDTLFPGLSLAGYLSEYDKKNILIFGKAEVDYLSDLTIEQRLDRLKNILAESTPAVILSKGGVPPSELIKICLTERIPLFRTKKPSVELMHKLSSLLVEELSPTICCHGSFVEVFGVGILIEGNPAVGKSEAALKLIERGHRLIADDLVKLKKKDNSKLIGYGLGLSKNHLEIRGIGIINVTQLYGSFSVEEKKNLDVVVKLEIWDDLQHYHRTGIDEKSKLILGISLPFYTLPVKPGRDVALLIETIALNFRTEKTYSNIG